MKRILSVITLLGYSVIVFSGCVTLQQLTQPTAQVDNTSGAAALPPYSGPKARMAVADFDVKAATATGEIGLGLREMLVTTLINSNRFLVVGRQAVSAVMQEQELVASGAAQAEGAQKGKIKTADLIITATVTEFEPRASGGSDGLGGGGGVGSGILGGLLGTVLNKAHMALDIQIVDTSTSEVLAATRLQGQASDIAGGFMGGFFSGGATLGRGLSAYANTPMEKAIRICIIEAVRYISQTIPANYYKY